MNTTARRTTLTALALAIALTAVLLGTRATQADATPTSSASSSSASSSSSGTATVSRAAQFDLAGDTGTGTGSHDRLTLDPTTNQIGAVTTPYSSMEAFLTAVYVDVDATWKRWAATWGFTVTPGVTAYWPTVGQSTPGGCGGPATATTFVYCKGTDELVISQQAAENLWNGVYGINQVTGTADMSVAVFVAHEYGHAIAADNNWSLGDAKGERIADCFAGFWAWDMSERGRIDNADWTEAYQGLAALADRPEYTTHIHGSAEERQQAFYLGATQGAAGCVSTFGK